MNVYKVGARCMQWGARLSGFVVQGVRSAGRGLINDQQSLLITVDRTVDQRFVSENF